MDRVAGLIAAFRRDPNLEFSEAELKEIEPAASDDVWAAKAIALHHIRAKDFASALPLLERIPIMEPSQENICNLIVGLRSLGRYDRAIRTLVANQKSLDRIVYCDLICSLEARAGRIPEAVRHGDEALALKHKAAPPVPPRDEYRIAAFDPEQPSRNVISFSIWGSQPRYLNGAVTNAIVARFIYPGWTARFYTDGNVPSGFVEALKKQGAEVVMVPDKPAVTHGLFWRFLVEDDPAVDLYIVRDCDSVLNVKERWAVADWLSRGRAFHLMRDQPNHSELILAGMWGAHRGNIGDMAGRIDAYLGRSRGGHARTLDQQFTREILWPIVQHDVVMHDSWFDFGDPVRFSPDFPMPSWMHIGQNETDRRRSLAP
jgi:hypothetical protein